MTQRDHDGLIAVPGADLFFRTRGTGPLLLTLQGGAGDANGSDSLAAVLADRYTVVAYDRRGLSRSTVEDPSEPIAVATHSNDASLLLAALGDEPAYVFGSSLGAVIALDLVTKHPAQVRVLVAHEAALADLLDEPERSLLRDRQRDVDATFKRAGLLPAIQKLLAIAGGVGDDPNSEITVERPAGERAVQHAANLQFFLARDAPAAHHHKLDTTALKANPGKIVPAAGVTSRGSLPHRCAASLATFLGRELHEFPGGHSGYLNRPKAFGEELHRVIASCS